MGLSRTPDALERKLRTAADALHDVPRVAVAEAAQHTKVTILAGSPARLRGVGRNGARLGVGYNLSPAGETPSALVYARGPWPLIEFDTAPHVEPRQRRSRRGARARVVVVPGGARGGVRSRVQHPGTKGQHPFRNGVHRAQPRTGRILESRTEAVLARVF